jgi:phosphoserine phosphatase RsbU/P
MRRATIRAQTSRYSEELACHITRISPIVENSPLGFAIISRELRVLYANQTMAGLWHQTVTDWIGRRIAHVLPDARFNQVSGHLRQVLRSGVAQVGIRVSLETDGDTHDFLISRYPVRNRQRVVVGVAIVAVDASTGVDHSALEEQAGRLRPIIDLANRDDATQRIAGIGTWEVDLATGHRLWSPHLHEMLDVDEATLAGATFGAFIHPEDQDRAYRAYQRLVDRGEPYRMDVRLVRLDHRIIHAVCTGHLVTDANGSAVRLWGTVQDVSDQVALESAHQKSLCAAAAARAALKLEHDAFQLIQRAMLPARVPELSEVDLAIAYQPMANAVDVGGDWYDAFVLPDGRLAVAVGDVSGHDLRAAMVMGQVRNAIRAYAVEDPRPGEVLRRANQLLMALGEAELVTAVFGVYDRAAHTLVLARAGHPQPLFRSGGQTRILTEPRGIILGVAGLNKRYAESLVALAPGDAVLFYTDGLVERRGRDTALMTERLCELTNSIDNNESAEGIVRAVTRVVLDPLGLEDDVCLLVLRRPGSADTPHPAMAATG